MDAAAAAANAAGAGNAGAAAPDPAARLANLEAEIAQLRANQNPNRHSRLNPFAHIPEFHAHPNEDWRSWLYDFELVGAAERWTDEMKYQKLPVFLQGAARDIYTQLDAAIHTNWDNLKTTLTTRFYTPEMIRDNVRAMLQRKQMATETVAEYGLAIRKLGLAAHPNMGPAELRNTLAEIYIDGLLPEYADRVYMTDPTDLDDAIRKASKVEAAVRIARLRSPQHTVGASESSACSSLETGQG